MLLPEIPACFQSINCADNPAVRGPRDADKIQIADTCDAPLSIGRGCTAAGGPHSDPSAGHFEKTHRLERFLDRFAPKAGTMTMVFRLRLLEFGQMPSDQAP